MQFMGLGNFFYHLKPSSGLPKHSDGQLALRKRRIRKEAELGGQLFGRPAKGCSREFFCLDAKTWVWHEVWIDATSRSRRQATLRYDIREPLTYKKQDDDLHWRPVSPAEKANLERAIALYRSRVLTRLYPGRDWSNFPAAVSER